MKYDRRIQLADFRDAIQPGGVLRPLLEWVHDDRTTRDAQVRRLPGGGEDTLAFYVGLTLVLTVGLSPRGWRAQRPHPSHVAAGDFEEAWLNLHDDPSELVLDLRDYLDRVAHDIVSRRPRHVSKEGRVHAQLARMTRPAVIDREAAVGFDDEREREERLGPVRNRLTAALADPPTGASAWWQAVLPPFGTGADFLAVESDGKLLVTEAKPARSGTLVQAPVQVMFYAEMFGAWASEAPHSFEIIDGMSEQRAQAGLGTQRHVTHPVTVAPAVIVGPPGPTDRVANRLRIVRDRLSDVSDFARRLRIAALDDEGVVHDLPA